MNWTAELDKLWKPPSHRVVTMSDEWKLARRGRLTASTRARSIAGVRAVSNFPKLRDKILGELSPKYQWTEASMPALDWGNDHEREALSNLELQLGLMDEGYEPGFLLHPERPYVGATPDLLVGTRITVQVKCPFDPKVHTKTMLTKKVPDLYWYQIQWEAWVSGARELLFVSYDPRRRIPDQRLVLVDVPRDDKMQRHFGERCDQFKDFVEGRLATARPLGLASYDSL